VTEPGALPVRSDGAMCIDVHFNQPAYAYLVWIDSAGQVLPLYPWNNESLEITDIHQPPPLRRPTKLLFSPLLGRSWTFGKTGGVETVLLLARRTPLPPETTLGMLVRALSPTPQLARSSEVIDVHLSGPGVPAAGAYMKGIRPEDVPLATFIGPLGDHFEFVRAIQFAHAGD
jgi:hypothetical protein